MLKKKIKKWTMRVGILQTLGQTQNEIYKVQTNRLLYKQIAMIVQALNSRFVFLYFRDGRVTSIIGKTCLGKMSVELKKNVHVVQLHSEIVFISPTFGRSISIEHSTPRTKQTPIRRRMTMTIDEINKALTVFLRKINNLQSSTWSQYGILEKMFHCRCLF